MAIDFTCRHCGWKATLDAQYAGQAGDCPACRRAINVPRSARPKIAAKPATESPVSKSRWRKQSVIVTTGLACTILTEFVTLYLRFGLGATAADFNRTAPLVLQVHHMFWSIPLFLAAVILRRKPKIVSALRGVAAGFVASDLLHHFVVLPLTVGNTGWHWP